MKLFKSSIHKPWLSILERILLIFSHVYDVCWTCSCIGPLFKLHLTILSYLQDSLGENRHRFFGILIIIAFMRVLLCILILYGWKSIQYRLVSYTSEKSFVAFVVGKYVTYIVPFLKLATDNENENQLYFWGEIGTSKSPPTLNL